jgi:type I restriction enzyme, S subunit
MPAIYFKGWKRAMLEVPKIDIRPDHWDIVRRILQKHVPQHKVWAFGSRAKWTAKEYSDLDLAVISDQPLSLEVIANLSDDFSESDLPWRVDVVDWATTSEPFRKIIARDKVVVQEGEKNLNVGSELQHILLGKACIKIGSGATPRGGKEVYLGGATALIRSQNIYNDHFSHDGLAYIDDSQANELRNVAVERGDVLLNITGDSVARCCQVDPDILPARVNQHVAIIRPEPNVLDARFLRYVLVSHSMQNHLLALASAGATRSALTKAMIESLVIEAPPLDQQRAIAHILSTLDDKIELNRRMNETLEGMARTLFKAWFVDFEPVRAKMEGRWQRGESLPGLPAHLYDFFPDRLMESELGEIPEGWKRVSASQLIDFNPSEALRKGADAPYLEMSSLPTTGSWPKPPISRPFGSGMRFRNGDTLLARITPCLENGKTAFVQCLPDQLVGWGSTEYIVMRTKDPIPSEFGYLLARDKAFREQAIRSMTGTSGRQRAQADSVATFQLASPQNAEAWNAFSNIVVPQFKNIKFNAQTIESLAQLRDTLLPKLISGELRVPDIERIVEAAL